MFKKAVFLILTWIFLIGNGNCLDCVLCLGKANDHQDPCSSPKAHHSSGSVDIITCDYSNAEKTWKNAEQIHPNYTEIFKITPMMFADDTGRDMKCITLLSTLGNTAWISRGCVLENRDICTRVKNSQNEFLKNDHCSTCGENTCNPADSLVENYGQRIILFLSITVLFIIVG